MSNAYREKKKATTYAVKTNCTVEEFLSKVMAGKSRTSLRQMLSWGVVRVSQKPVKRLDEVILAGQSVTIYPKPERQFEMPKSLKIIYEDDWLIVVDKAAGLLTIATETEKEHTAYAYLSAYLKFYKKSDKIFIVHRIDRQTSGLLVFAKSEMVQRALRENWDDAVVSRKYTAVAEGHFVRKQGTISTWIDEDEDSLKMYVTRPGVGKRAVTHYRVIDETFNLSLLELELETGRKNQIRVHMKYAGHILVGDKKCGSRVDVLGRLCLHAGEISFYHPMTGRLMRFESKVPPDFLKLFRKD